MLAVALKRRDFRESDQVISFFTEDQGKLELLAQGVKKITSKNSPQLEPFTLAHIDVARGKEIDHLIRASAVNLFPRIRSNLNKSLMAGFISAFFDTVLQPKEKDERVFHLFKTWLEFLDSSNEEGSANRKMLGAFVIKFFSLLGFTPELERCVVCGLPFAPEKVWGFCFAGGGLIGPEDRATKEKAGEKVTDISMDDVENLKLFLSANWEAASQMILDEKEEKKLWDIVYTFAQFHSERRLPRWVDL